MHKSSPFFCEKKQKLLAPTTIFEDNKGTRDYINAYKVTSNLRHIEIPLRHLQELHKVDILQFQHCSWQVMLADILTKT